MKNIMQPPPKNNHRKITAITTKNLSRYSLYVALAFILSYVEALFPFSLGIPGVKLGLANIVIVYVLYTSPSLSGLYTVILLRTVLTAFTFGNLSTLLYSMCGGFLSASGMFLLYKMNLFSVYGISIAGGVFHNIGQLIVAAFVLETPQLIYYMPVILFSGMIAGFCIGFISDIITKRLHRP